MDNQQPTRITSLNNQAAQPQVVAKGIKCSVSKRVSLNGMPICYMVRDTSVDSADCGWSFLSGEELDQDEQYLNYDSNFQIFDVNTIINYDVSILPLLNAPVGTAFERANRISPWQQVTDILPDGTVIDPYMYQRPSQST